MGNTDIEIWRSIIVKIKEKKHMEECGIKVLVEEGGKYKNDI